MQALSNKIYSLSEYLELEKSTDIKHEYHAGLVYAMAGGTLNHGLICGNVFAELRKSLDKSEENCIPLNSEIKLFIQSANSYVYPDAMVICEGIEKSNSLAEAVTNPTVIVEVLSASTSSYDRGEKFYFYRQIPTLKEYILIEQDKMQIESFVRQGELWKISRTNTESGMLHIESLDIFISMTDIYQNIIFESNA